MSYYKILSKVSSARHMTLRVIYFMQCVYVNPKLLHLGKEHTPLPSLGSLSFFSVCRSISVLYMFTCIFSRKDSTYEQYHTAFASGF